MQAEVGKDHSVEEDKEGGIRDIEKKGREGIGGRKARQPD